MKKLGIKLPLKKDEEEKMKKIKNNDTNFFRVLLKILLRKIKQHSTKKSKKILNRLGLKKIPWATANFLKKMVLLTYIN